MTRAVVHGSVSGVTRLSEYSCCAAGPVAHQAGVRTTPFRIYSMIYGLGGTIYILETTEIIKVVNRSLDGETGHV